MMSRLSEQLLQLRGQGLLNDIDVHFAHLMDRISPVSDDSLQLAAALASHACSEGHVCLQLDEWAGRPVGGASDARLPELNDWVSRLRGCPVVAEPPGQAPLVLDHGGRLYLYRYWRYERALADALVARSTGELALPEGAGLGKALDSLFPQMPGMAIDWQRMAAVVAVLKRLVVITGGPGTGKTSTVVRMLALLQQMAGQRPLAVALAAPTGKAAARLQASIRQAKSLLSLPPAVQDSIPEQATTLHRLLGSRPGSVYFRHDAEHPLPLDLLVVDEASMVDLALMAKVVAALPPDARLILLGDRDQLASVEAGSVLGDICGEWQGFSRSFCRRIEALTGVAPFSEPADERPLADVVVALQHSYRFDSQGGIGRLARLVNQGMADDAAALLRASESPQLGQLDIDADPVELAVRGYRDYLREIDEGGDPLQVFRAFDRFRVLCVLRGGVFGVEQMNRAITQRLQREGLVPTAQPWFTGQPLLITRNDHGLRLYNGDIGILLPDESGRAQVCFPTADGYRRVSPSRLPAHETAFAMTVHKSQGSEFDQVLLMMPESDAPLLSRELVYTALTRARQAFLLFDRNRLLGNAIRRRTRRHSGLRSKLWYPGREEVCDPDHR
ncbi:MAG: exodeoxyribonuclease V subunit alpha [Sedimenticola sp.]|nr:exodeoxyribonuclease V subunit alpha [Sedimenticola sp.]